ncbi:MAG: DUF445 family protein [Desulfuromonas sp.]|nr:DUF445 family protein [Desulfuromonas sp.]
MLSTIDSYWPYLLPPLLGAVIGYVTNYIAIRMLFRPLRPWYIFRLRIPLTPGIIPSQRHKLASKMGEMVGSHLLTSQDIAQALDKPEFRTKLQQALASKLDNFISRDLGPLITLLPERFHKRFFESVDMLRWKLTRALGKYISTPEFEQRLQNFCLEQITQLLSKDVKHYLSAQRYSHSRQHIAQRLQEWLNSKNLATSVSTFIDSKSEEIISSGKSLQQLIPTTVVDTILEQLEQELPGLIQQLAASLDNPHVREQLELKARQTIADLIDSIEGLSAIIGALFDMEKIYARLPQFIDTASAELATWLESEQVQSNLSTALRQKVTAWLEQPLSTYLAQMPHRKIVAIKRFMRTTALNFIRSDDCRQLLLGWLDKGVDSIKDRPLQELLQQVGSEDSAAKISQQLASTLIELAQTPALQHRIEIELERQIDYWLTQRPLGELSSRLPSDAREELYNGLFDQLLLLLNKEVPPLVDSLDICRVVEDKVNSLDILKVEELLMGIMKEQFKYINIFGALLGMLIGMLNLLLLRL